MRLQFKVSFQELFLRSQIASIKERQNDEYGQLHASGLHSAGRIVLNLWRSLRSEIKLPIYTFESCVAALMQLRTPHFPSWFLTDCFNAGPSGISSDNNQIYTIIILVIIHDALMLVMISFRMQSRQLWDAEAPGVQDKTCQLVFIWSKSHGKYKATTVKEIISSVGVIKSAQTRTLFFEAFFTSINSKRNWVKVTWHSFTLRER